MRLHRARARGRDTQRQSSEFFFVRLKDLWGWKIDHWRFCALQQIFAIFMKCAPKVFNLYNIFNGITSSCSIFQWRTSNICAYFWNGYGWARWKQELNCLFVAFIKANISIMRCERNVVGWKCDFHYNDSGCFQAFCDAFYVRTTHTYTHTHNFD